MRTTKHCRRRHNVDHREFICIRCNSSTGISVTGMQRRNEKEKYHVKDCWCCNCKQVVKAMEVRPMDYKPDIIQKAKEMYSTYYTGNGELKREWVLADNMRKVNKACL